MRRLVVHVVGARPNYMKIAPVYGALAGEVEQLLVHTGQHYDPELKDVFFAELPLPRPDHELRVGSGSRAEQVARATTGLAAWFDEVRPDLVVVAGDVNSTVAGAFAASLASIPVCHVEAGLRSFDPDLPEEHNRRATDQLSALLLTHSADADANLEREGIPAARVAMVGNTMVDTLLANVDEARALAAWNDAGVERGAYLLVTLHRQGLVDVAARLVETMEALGRVAAELPVVFPVHPRTRARLEALAVEPPAGVTLLPPLPYRRFLSLQAGAAGVLTDSGGIQEETTALGIPCFTLRDSTERPVTVSHGTNTIIGVGAAGILDVPRLLHTPRARSVPPLWDGRAGGRAAAEILRVLG
jgi:UDP-N-acetylglucosamine 2-epimerase (non-hydrolysing)